jgi:NAD(P)-dependent dehydrogenase (short-subunit alcohol dehydrogenase family)
MCLGLAADGATVMCVDLDGAAAAETATLASRSGGQALSCAADVASEPDVRAIFSEVATRWGELHFLVNAAGILIQRSLVDYDMEDWDRQLAVNLKGPFLCLQAASRIMMARGYGKIVNVASTSAFVSSTTPKLGYDASKGGLRQLTVSAAVELAPYGIRVNAIAPGTIKTPMSAPHWQSADSASLTAYLKRIPLGYLGAPEDLVGPTTFLCSGESDYVTGHVLVVDGGWLAI